MRFGIMTLDDFDVGGKTVLCRVDINQPINREKGTLRDTTRIKGCVPTVRELSDKGARVVLLAHQGSDIEYHNFFSTRPHAAVLSDFLARPVKFIDDVCGPAAREAISRLSDGEILLLDNVRYLGEEQTLFELNLGLSHEEQSKTLLVQTLAPLADLYVCDAFAAAHRNQPSLCGFEQLLPSAMGRLFEREYCEVSKLMEAPARPCLFILGGAKISDTFMMMETVLKNGTADAILTGGLVANVMLAATQKPVGSGSLALIRKSGHEKFLEAAETLCKNYPDKIVLPLDLAGSRNGLRIDYALSEVPEDLEALDIGQKTAEMYAGRIRDVATVFLNGPMGVFEQEETSLGTRTVMEALGNSKAYTVVGGGDSITALKRFDQTDRVSYICTGGGALIRFLTGEELPVVKALRTAAERGLD
ncbi:MAG: phosphoglycerate kinase [Saccharofermentanales bacterium]